MCVVLCFDDMFLRYIYMRIYANELRSFFYYYYYYYSRLLSLCLELILSLVQFASAESMFYSVFSPFISL